MSTECCSWDGVHCSPATKHVNRLHLYSYGYTVNISLFLPFGELRSLTLLDNHFDNCIPSDCFESLAKLNNLEYLDLSGNNFDSKALSSLAALSSLKALSLRYFWVGTESFINGMCIYGLVCINLAINGDISSACQAWSNMSRLLENLNLAWNSLNERIIPCLIKVSSLKILDLSENKIGGNFSLKEICKLNNLVELNLYGNKLNGVSPLMVDWTSLKRLYINSNELNGTSLEGNNCLILQRLCKIKNLEELDVSYNDIKGNIPMCFGHLSSLRYIDISYNQFGTHFPSSVIKNLTMLKYVYFSDNNFEDILFIDLFFNNTDLKTLDLSNNYKLEIKTQHLGMVPSFQLNEIILSNCILNKPSSFPTFLSNQYMIDHIDLSSVNLKGTIPLWLFENKTKLSSLNLRNNLLNGQLIFPSQKSNITYLAMSHNSLKGDIPSSFGNLNQLIFLDLSFNNLTGPFPSCMRNLSYLRAINLRENKLEGNLTYEFCHSSNIEYLDLSKYNFSDWVSSCINKSNLEYLNINGNSLTGPFPSAILGNSLVALDIGNNNFVGNIPNKIWASLKNLEIISLKGNYFEGVLSREICKVKYLRVLDLSQNKLHGNIPSCLHYMGSKESSRLRGDFFIGFAHSEKRDGLYNLHSFTYEFEYIEFSTKGRSDSYQGTS
ncbi:Non-specific serine/threonine protein kinase protein [Dioscorea alata]|uniref:Non-specific serine/threonine protein kinase protein n=1 Tax=Dioscorea alata TaxID=55571 RepID=A0ACB7WKF9_DIOAL|nr:Non-specific serine/threonine protein kinase protein [Dioscorea alata]